MRLLSNVASRRFAGITTTRKLSSTSNGFVTRPGANLNIDAHGGGPRYRNFSTSNKALDGFAFNPFTKTLPFRKPLPYFSAKCLEIKDADFAWFTALNVAVRTQRNRVYLSHPDRTPRAVLHDYQHTLRVVADAE
ncbi:uncharacterized protein J4E88_009503 [Alternaria novae-zelandiae]|uniref:uncharacterized protein n=1 Tax=Alternaria novae-zelandiae TaxID=430562 RepID=UPI0020C24D6D|nr:uncharacterized protein J4E88_009503 [Alternaria novae-zelandiae]KAI4671105.1 hypothetical protein J4E88_009503 [Alternaria novae-zelandiae]